MKIIAGLGNPGEKYELTRHNAGFLVLDNFATLHRLDWRERPRFNAEVAELKDLSGSKALLVKPTTFMNESGRALRTILDFHKLATDDLLVIHDDADLDFGKLKIVHGGSGAGHKGVEDISRSSSGSIWRIKIGVSNKDRQPGQAIDFVLRKFDQTEIEKLDDLYSKTNLLIQRFIDGSLNIESMDWL